MTVLDEFTGARHTMTRRLAWHETDAAGHNHFAAAMRWLEEGEHALWRSLGQSAMVGAVPRVHVEADYLGRIFFDDELEVTTGVIRVGRTSASFGTVVRRDGQVVVETRHVVAYAPDPRGGAQPWPEDVRALLETPPAAPDAG
ncbi:thioesterase [Enemella evansiae]|uniref:acyl-CoA thioesterase n=1 Tax=Enemella evansiae TaxID=2016499 RepID=UPI000B966932|nr:thioesterase family protein [Enemella evansiae]OYO06761.1 thioesterase [Enemella evansiae]